MEKLGAEFGARVSDPQRGSASPPGVDSFRIEFILSKCGELGSIAPCFGGTYENDPFSILYVSEIHPIQLDTVGRLDMFHWMASHPGHRSPH
jgi:hypothetical protein